MARCTGAGRGVATRSDGVEGAGGCGEGVGASDSRDIAAGVDAAGCDSAESTSETRASTGRDCTHATGPVGASGTGAAAVGPATTPIRTI
jgi:hypothetical protein